jgi:hypothetical protein
LSVGWESIVYIKRRKKAAAYKTRPSMPRAWARAGATGDAGGAAGGKERSTKAQTNTRECPANGISIFLILKHGVKKQSVTQIAQFYVRPTAVSAGSPHVVRRLFEVNLEPHTGTRPSARLCVGLKSQQIGVE